MEMEKGKLQTIKSGKLEILSLVNLLLDTERNMSANKDIIFAQ